MKILIVAATNFELRPLLQKITYAGTEEELLQHYRYLNHEIDFLMTGIGMAQTAFHLGAQLQKKKYDLALNAGIAGAYSTKIRIGTLFNVKAEAFGLLGAEEEGKFLSIFDLGLADPDAFPYQGGWLLNETVMPSPLIETLPVAKGVTVNMIHATRKTIDRLNEIYHGDVESMEGAAFFYSCLMQGIPFIQIRAVSNYVEERDKSKWNIPLSLNTLNKFLEHLLTELQKK